MTDTRKELKKVLGKYITHYNCEGDTWYGCPKSINGCCNEDAGDECNCYREERLNNAINEVLGLGLVKKENLTLDEDKLVEIISDEMCCQTIDECAMTRTTAKAIASQADKLIKQKGE